jgi:hypothetical protein
MTHAHVSNRVDDGPSMLKQTRVIRGPRATISPASPTPAKPHVVGCGHQAAAGKTGESHGPG